ncbi:MAG: hypothetical protein AB1898_21745 [Acidobacteriota bacterium]
MTIKVEKPLLFTALAMGLVLFHPLGTRSFQQPSPSGIKPSAEPFDAVPFGMIQKTTDANSYTVRWSEPRKIRRVSVQFAPDATVPPSDSVELQYWHQSWDGRADPVWEEAGAGRVGWHSIDDWTNGQWKRADTVLQISGKTWQFTFRLTGATEFKNLSEPGVTFRKTLQLRLVSAQKLPAVAAFRAFTDAVYGPLSVRIHFGKPAESRIRLGPDDIALEIHNGRLLEAGAGNSLQPKSGGGLRWTLPEGAEGRLQVQALMAVDPYGGPYDRTIITVRSKFRPFSFAADEVAQGDRILVDDLGALAVRGDDPISLEDYRAIRAELPNRTVYDRVLDESEQTLGRAWEDMPLKHPLYFVHGLPGNRNSMRQDPDGSVRIAAGGRWFDDFPSSRDSRKWWDPAEYKLSFGFPQTEAGPSRELEQGYLPLLRTRWSQGPISYEQRTVLDKLDGDLAAVRLDDPSLLLMRVRMVNTSDSEEGVARLFLSASGKTPETLRAEGDRVVADYQGAPRLRYLIDVHGRGQLRNQSRGVEWSLSLKPGEAQNVDFWIPSITLSNQDEIDALKGHDFEKDSRRVGRYWEGITARGTQIQTPEPWLNDFYKAHVRHLLVNCFKELDSDLLHAHVGTFHYGVYPNESVMMISDLDRRGYHDEARRNLESYLRYQGTVAFLGNYRSKTGLFYGAGGHETGNYNKSHGYVLWAMAEHWRLTRDRDWLARAAPKLVEACDWVSRERRATMALNPDGGRPIEYGSLPAGSLEDVTDFWFWLATNSATAWGFESLAEALADYGHPEAPRLQREAKAYREDVMQGLEQARILSPVVRLRDGTYVPKYPSHLHQRGRSHGWLRETLEGSLFLLYYRLVPPDSPEAGWILKDYEDNLYISERYGYSIPAFDRFWFSRGGFSMQANLLDSPPPYLYRDQIKHYLRAYFNAFASAFYPEIRMCNEHSLPELGYPMGDHFKSSDEAQSTYWLRLMFVSEQGKDLYLGQAIPRYWLKQGQSVAIERAASHFGPLSFRITSDVERGTLKALVDPPSRNQAETIYVRFRHPQQKSIQKVSVNGRDYSRFDPAKEWVVLSGDVQGRQEIVVSY